MRGAALIPALLLISCSSEPSFDQRYATAETAIREKAREMDAELAERERRATDAAAAQPAAAANTPAPALKPRR